MKNFITRSLSAVVYAALLIIGPVAGHYYFGAVLLLLNVLAAIEYCKLTSDMGKGISLPIFLVSSTVVFISFFLYFSNNQDEKMLILALVASFPLFVAGLFQKDRPSFTSIAFGLAGLLYITLPLASMSLLYDFNKESGYRLVLAFLVLIWSNDTFAYITGMLIGKHQLFKNISPKKTVEGAAGGLLVTLVIAFFAGEIIPFMNRIEWIGFAAVIVFFGTFGDLVESLLKRSAGVKDSGTLIPGHGGVLDRIDSILLAAPFAVGYLMLAVK